MARDERQQREINVCSSILIQLMKTPYLCMQETSRYYFVISILWIRMFSSVMCSTISRVMYVWMYLCRESFNSWKVWHSSLLPSHSPFYDTTLNVFVQNKRVGVEEIRFGMRFNHHHSYLVWYNLDWCVLVSPATQLQST